MKLTWANEQQNTIKMELDEGETLGNQHGPTTAFVPIDPLNTDFAEILRLGYAVDPFTPTGG